MEDISVVTDRLYKAGGITYERIAPTEINPFISLILSYVIPIVLMILLWKFLFKQMSKSGMGGNFMSFGKSNAKIYVKAQTGKTFSDVAGQEEAKEEPAPPEPSAEEKLLAEIRDLLKDK